MVPDLVMSNNPQIHFCTIISKSHLAYAKALRDSILQFNEEGVLHILVIDEKVTENYGKEKGTLFYGLDKLSSFALAASIIQLYNAKPDQLRWSLKPGFLAYLLEENESPVIYVDCDIHFFSDYHFLFSRLTSSSLLLSPHFRALDPFVDSNNFLKNFSEGIFNGGFIGASSLGLPALKWWASACEYACRVDKGLGLYDDQKYLDLLPARFDKVDVLDHKGCNLAGWNKVDCRRSLVNGEVRINETYPVVFIHFADSTAYGMVYGDDVLLKPYFEIYASRILKYNPDIDLKKKIQLQHIQFQNMENETVSWRSRILSALRQLKHSFK